jgi:hypothetical protein
MDNMIDFSEQQVRPRAVIETLVSTNIPRAESEQHYV